MTLDQQIAHARNEMAPSERGLRFVSGDEDMTEQRYLTEEMKTMTKTLFYAQGDLLIERVDDIEPGTPLPVDPDGAVVLARGEVTGHRHAIHGGAAVLFRDEGLARDMPAELYIGHVRVVAPTALTHEEHAPIPLEPGTYRIRRQREWTTESTRVVAD